ncbi:MAG: HipA N-terminal domain-containing protein [Sediminibacterium sp.]|jgi:HipA-like protein|nr:HipA N-terminal domain-containing protein [Sediminibacterium sp.]
MKAEVFNNGILAGILEKQLNGTYSFEYDEVYLQNDKNPSISLTMPRSIKKHESEKLFAFFFGLLSEGVNKNIQCRLLKIDENDHFGRLLLTAQEDNIGAITLKPL